MADLSHWDLAETFTGREAAYLLMGVDPSGPEAYKRDIHHVLRRLGRARDSANKVAWRHIARKELGEAFEYLKCPKSFLFSEALESNLEFFACDVDDGALEDYLNNPPRVSEEFFARYEFARWVRENNVPSIYQFDLQASVPAKPSESCATVPQAAMQAELDSMRAMVENMSAAPLAKRERNSLLAIIAVLCTMADVDYTKHAKSAGIILNKAAEMGVAIGETTIEGHLKKIPEALEARTK